MSEQNKAVVRRLIEDHWNAKNRALVSELFAPMVTIHTPDGVLKGLDGASMLLQAYVTAFPDFRPVIDDLVADADKVAFRWTFNGSHRGPLANIPASGKQVSVASEGMTPHLLHPFEYPTALRYLLRVRLAVRLSSPDRDATAAW